MVIMPQWIMTYKNLNGLCTSTVAGDYTIFSPRSPERSGQTSGFFLVHRQRRLPVAGLVGSQSRPLLIPTRAVVSGESPANYAVCASNNSIKPSGRNVRGLSIYGEQ
jgi:hypothetical protein